MATLQPTELEEIDLGSPNPKDIVNTDLQTINEQQVRYIQLEAGENIAAWLPMYIAADGKFWLSAATNDFTKMPCAAISIEAKNAGQDIRGVYQGEIENSAWAGWTAGQIAYLKTDGTIGTTSDPTTIDGANFYYSQILGLVTDDTVGAHRLYVDCRYPFYFTPGVVTTLLFEPRSGAPSAIGTRGALYTLNVGGTIKLYFKDNGGNIICISDLTVGVSIRHRDDYLWISDVTHLEFGCGTVTDLGGGTVRYTPPSRVISMVTPGGRPIVNHKPGTTYVEVNRGIEGGVPERVPRQYMSLANSRQIRILHSAHPMNRVSNPFLAGNSELHDEWSGTGTLGGTGTFVYVDFAQYLSVTNFRGGGGHCGFGGGILVHTNAVGSYRGQVRVVLVDNRHYDWYGFIYLDSADVPSTQVFMATNGFTVNPTVNANLGLTDQWQKLELLNHDCGVDADGRIRFSVDDAAGGGGAYIYISGVYCYDRDLTMYAKLQYSIDDGGSWADLCDEVSYQYREIWSTDEIGVKVGGWADIPDVAKTNVLIRCVQKTDYAEGSITLQGLSFELR